MLNSGKKIRASRNKKKILPLVLSEENFLNETKNLVRYDLNLTLGCHRFTILHLSRC